MATRAPKTAAAPVAAAVDTNEGTAAQPVADPLPADSLQDDAADVQAEAAADVGADDAPADDADDADDYPLTLTLTNTSGHVFSCSVTGVVSQSGSTATVTLHDQAHADAFADSLEQFTRYLPADAVKVDRA